MWDTAIQDISRHKLDDSLTIQIHMNLFPSTDLSFMILKTSILVFGERYSVYRTNDLWQLYNPTKPGLWLLYSLGSWALNVGSIFDENQSWYLEENVATHGPQEPGWVNLQDETFLESNKMHGL